MAELLDHIAEVARTTRSIVQIVPETSVHPFMTGLTRIMTFHDAPPLVYTEGLHSGQVVDFPSLVATPKTPEGPAVVFPTPVWALFVAAL